MGNRVTKYHRTISTNLEVLTYYVRDAQGNVMATYETNYLLPSTDNYVLKELNIYGSSRIGVLNADVKIKNEPINLRGDPPVNSTLYATANKKQYELTNHLGNVLSTVSDAAPSSHQAVLLSSNDYYPFGSPMPNRNFSSSEYRFGFNGQEKTDEISGEGNHLDFKFRGYDSRTGRFWSVDPLFKEYTWNSSYAFAENDVIRHVDLEGLEKGTRPATNTTTAIDNTRPSIFIGDLILKSKTPVPKQWVSTNPNLVFNILENVEAKLQKTGNIENTHAGTGPDNAPFHSMDLFAKSSQTTGILKTTATSSFTDRGSSTGKMTNTTTLKEEITTNINEVGNISVQTGIGIDVKKGNPDDIKGKASVPLLTTPIGSIYVGATFSSNKGVERIEFGFTNSKRPTVEAVKMVGSKEINK
jgi:RHS repeat-associated protein